LHFVITEHLKDLIKLFSRSCDSLSQIILISGGPNWDFTFPGENLSLVNKCIYSTKFNRWNDYVPQSIHE